MEEEEARALEQRNIQDYVSEHLIELLEQHLTLSSTKKEGGGEEPAKPRAFKSLNSIRHDDGDCGCKNDDADGPSNGKPISYTVNCFTSVTFWISDRFL